MNMKPQQTQTEPNTPMFFAEHFGKTTVHPFAKDVRCQDKPEDPQLNFFSTSEATIYMVAGQNSPVL